MPGLRGLEARGTRSSSIRAVNLKFLVDMNLSPQWAPVLWKQGWQAVHWSTIGHPGASDEDIMG